MGLLDDFTVSWEDPIVPSRSLAGIPLGISIEDFERSIDKYLVDGGKRLYKFLNSPNRSITQSDPALATALESALQSGGVKVQGVTVKVGLPAPSKTGQAEIKVEPWPKK